MILLLLYLFCDIFWDLVPRYNVTVHSCFLPVFPHKHMKHPLLVHEEFWGFFFLTLRLLSWYYNTSVHLCLFFVLNIFSFNSVILCQVYFGNNIIYINIIFHCLRFKFNSWILWSFYVLPFSCIWKSVPVFCWRD